MSQRGDPASVLSGPGEWRFRVAFESAAGELTHSGEFDDEDPAAVYFESVSKQVPNPSQEACWLERRLVTRWEKFGERKGDAVVFNGG